MKTLFLVDNSVTQRISLSAPVHAAWLQLLDQGSIASCLPQLLEEGYSARSEPSHEELIGHNVESKILLRPLPGLVEVAIDLQRRLFAAGKGRSVGISDLQIAATALCYDGATTNIEIVHYDSDFDHLAAIEPRLRTRWIVPRGSA